MISNYKELLENNVDMLWEVDLEGKYTYVNKAAEKILGYKIEDIIGKTPFDFMPLHERDKIAKEFLKIIQNEKPFYNLENINFHKNGHKITLETSGQPIFDDNKNLVGFMGIDRDISEKKKLQNELHTMNALLRENVSQKTKDLNDLVSRFDFAIQGTQDGLWDWNIETGEVFYSKRWKEMLGYSDSELGNELETWSNLIHPDDYERCMKTIEKSMKNDNGFFEITHRLKHKNNSWVWILDRAKVFFNEDSKAIRMAGFHTDITKKIEDEKLLKDKERMLLEQSKMASMGEMINNIAHQWRQPLSLITTISSGIKLQKELGTLNDDTLLDSMETVQDSANYLSDTIDDFRTFFKPNKNKTYTNIQKIMNRTIKLISAQFKSHDIKIIENTESIELEIYENELIQALVNILNNARDELVSKRHSRIVYINTILNKDTVIITIKDNAGGIPEEYMDKIFNPDFTTKADADGTGIGLFMTKEVIEEHILGSIEVSNINFMHEEANYNGAEFKISIQK